MSARVFGTVRYLAWPVAWRRVRQALVLRASRRRARRELAALDGRALADLGLGPGDRWALRADPALRDVTRRQRG